MKVFLFCRYPEEGKVKTRIAAESGDQAALAIYERMLNVVFENLNKSDYSFEVHHTGGDRIEVEYWLQNMVSRPQANGDLGEKLSYAVKNWFEFQNEPLVIIGSDQLEIDNAVLQEVEEKLESCDIVLGPAEDGGYYLIGLRKECPEIFKNISWGTETVLAETVDRINESGMSYFQLPVRADIDYFSDVPENWKKELLLHENSD